MNKDFLRFRLRTPILIKNVTDMFQKTTSLDCNSALLYFLSNMVIFFGKNILHLQPYHLFGFCLDCYIESQNSLDRSKLRPSQTPTIHPSEFFGHITFSVPNIKLQKMKSESCWKLYNIQSKNSIMVMWSVQLCIARMGVDGGGGVKRVARILCIVQYNIMFWIIFHSNPNNIQINDS